MSRCRLVASVAPVEQVPPGEWPRAVLALAARKRAAVEMAAHQQAEPDVAARKRAAVEMAAHQQAEPEVAGRQRVAVARRRAVLQPAARKRVGRVRVARRSEEPTPVALRQPVVPNPAERRAEVQIPVV